MASSSKEDHSLETGLPISQAELLHNVRGVYKFVNNLERANLWSMKMVEELHALTQWLPGRRAGEKYEVTGFNDKKVKLRVPQFDPKEQYLGLQLVGYQVLSQNMDEEGHFKITSNPYRMVPFFIVAWNKTDHMKDRTCVPQTNRPLWDIWKHEWDGKIWVERKKVEGQWVEAHWRDGRWTKYSQKLKGLVKKHWQVLKNVDKIICFALGALQSDIRIATGNPENPYFIKEHPRAYVQHLAAATIRDTLYNLACQESQEGENVGEGKGKGKVTDTGSTKVARVPIIAQDPTYCEECKRILENELNIEATQHMDGFLALTKNTFVICIAPSADIVGIVCDITPGFQGPLAMLCDEIQIDYKRWDHKGEPGNNQSPWLKWDQWDGSEPKAGSGKEAGDTSDRPTRNMIDHALRCRSATDDFGDHKDVTGITLREFHTKYRKLPVVAEIREERGKFAKGEAGDREYEKKFETYGMKYEEFLRFSHKAHATSNFGDLKLYVRKD